MIDPKSGGKCPRRHCYLTLSSKQAPQPIRVCAGFLSVTLTPTFPFHFLVSSHCLFHWLTKQHCCQHLWNHPPQDLTQLNDTGCNVHFRAALLLQWDRARPPQGLKQETAFLPLHTVCRISRGCHRNPVSMSESVCKENIRSSYYSVHLSLPINFPRDLFQVLAVHKIGVIGIQKSIANHQELGQVRSCQSR